MKDDTTGKPHN